MPTANDLLIFAKAVEFGGFAQAGRHLSMPKSTVSKRVAQLEDDLGTRLINRTSRSFTLTDVGRDVYEHAKAAAAEIENARSVVQRRLAEPSGKVRMTVSVAMLHFELAQALPTLIQRHPKLNVSVHATDNFVDVVKEGFDIAVRSHFSPLRDSGLQQRRLRVEPLILVASPGYLADRPALRTPADLAEHFGLPGGTSCTTWRLIDRRGNIVNVDPRARVTVDEAFANVNTAAAGLGVTILPRSYCGRELERGELVQVLEGWTAGEFTTTALMPHRSGQLPAVRAVLDFLQEIVTAPRVKPVPQKATAAA